jgi:anti-sigma B factor antagonist
MAEPQPFRVELVQDSDESAIVRVAGELEITTCPEFRLCLDEAIEQSTPRIVIDLTGATFIDSAAMGALVSCGRRLAERDALLEIWCRENNVARALRVTGLDHMFAVRRPAGPSD